MKYSLLKDDPRIPLDDGRVNIGDSFNDLKVDDFLLVGSGGTSLVYLARINGNRACIVKEYWPKEKSSHEVKYVRDLKTGEIILEGTEEQIEKEREAQRISKVYETEVNNRLYYDPGEPDSNSNHMFHLQGEEGYFRVGETYYSIFETTRGKTLYERVTGSSVGKLDIETACKITRNLIEIVKFMFLKRGYCHGDLKPENIWCGNDCDDNDIGENLYVIDFGSAFSWRKYIEKEYNSVRDYLDLVDDIVNNPGIGWSSDNYRSAVIANLMAIKKECKMQKDMNARRKKLEHGQKLLECMRKINIFVDLYAVIKIFYFMILGEDYHMSDPISAEKISEIAGCEVMVAEFVNDIMFKNANGRYSDIMELAHDLQCLEALYRKEASPVVWLKGVISRPELELEGYDSRYVCDIKE